MLAPDREIMEETNLPAASPKCNSMQNQLEGKNQERETAAQTQRTKTSDNAKRTGLKNERQNTSRMMTYKPQELEERSTPQPPTNHPRREA